ATTYVEGERARQKALVASLCGLDGMEADDVAAEAEEAWRLLQVWDRLSLLVCMQPLRAGIAQSLPAVHTPAGEARIDVESTPDGRLRLDPYPFANDPASFVVEAFRTTSASWASPESFRRDVRLADRVLVRL